jgi:ribose-phosphate pyrophosphokinase
MPFYLVMLTKNREIAIKKLIVTDSIPLKKESNKIRVLSCASFAEVMHMVHHNNSISGKFIM